MIKGIYYAARSLNNGFQKMNNIANNLANINTTGYKRQIPFSEMMIKAGQSEVTQFTDFAQGNFIQTSSQLDLAISGDGFFAVQTPSGIRLTRNGHFNLSDDGFILDQNGNKLLGTKGAINLNDFIFDKEQDIKIMTNGDIYLNDQLIDTLLVLKADNPLTLQRDSNLDFFSPSEDYFPVDENNFKIMQGYLEESNVNPIVEMESMIKTSSDYQSSYKIINFLDKSLEKANEIGKV